MGRSWSSLPLDRVVHLLGASAEAFELATEPLPDDAPAILTYYPRPEPTIVATVESLLSRLEQDAVQLFPAWLPGAEHIEDARGAGVAAVRSMALRLSTHTPHFGPFMADLAEEALGRRRDRVAKYPAEVRAPALARVIAGSYGRNRIAMLVDVPREMTPAARQALGGACEWLVAKGGFGIWLCGSNLPADDRVDTIRLGLPARIAEIVKTATQAAPPVAEVERGQLCYPPIAGRPRYNSPAEKRLEEALLGLSWAKGRIWNRPFPQRPEYVIDLLWTAERCAVEIDGDDHRGALKFAKDRRRDVLLHLDGYAVLRFTNDRITGELDQVLAELKQYLEQKRGRG